MFDNYRTYFQYLNKQSTFKFALLGFCGFLTFHGVNRVPKFRERNISNTLIDDTEITQQINRNWVQDLGQFRKKVYSQANQDGIIEQVFSKITPHNRKFVEFGFGYANNAKQILGLLNGTNTYYLTKKGWTGWRFDALLEHKPISLYRELLSYERIESVFLKYKIPFDVDYVSIDVDSVDLWLLIGLLKNRRYRPRLITIEYNANFPYHSPVTCDKVWQPWNRDVVYGCSAGAILEVAKEYQYEPLYVEGVLDIFLSPVEVLRESGGRGLSTIDLQKKFPLPRNVHRIFPSTNFSRMIDYKVFKETQNIAEARNAAKVVTSELVTRRDELI